MVEDSPAPWFLKPVEVHGVDLLLRMKDRKIVLVGELLAGKNHRNADRGHQADESELDSPFCLPYAVVVEKIEQALVPKALNVVRGHVVDRLRSIGEAEQAAINEFAHRPLKTRLLLIILRE